MKRYNTPHRHRVIKTRLTEEEYAEAVLAAHHNVAEGQEEVHLVKSCSPLSAAKWQRQKSRQSRGKSGDFFAPCAKKYYSSLDRLDSRNGDRAGIVLSGEICYT